MCSCVYNVPYVCGPVCIWSWVCGPVCEWSCVYVVLCVHGSVAEAGILVESYRDDTRGCRAVIFHL